MRSITTTATSKSITTTRVGVIYLTAVVVVMSKRFVSSKNCEFEKKEDRATAK